MHLKREVRKYTKVSGAATEPYSVLRSEKNFIYRAADEPIRAAFAVNLLVSAYMHRTSPGHQLW